MAYTKPDEAQPERKKLGPTMCDWNEHGESCRWRGILSPGNLGNGPWYCREHFYKMKGYPGMVEEGLHGNKPPKTPLHSFAVDEILERMRKKFEVKIANAINPVAFITPIEDEETEAAFAAYMAEPAKEEPESPPEYG